MKYIRTKDGRIGFVSSVREYNGSKPLVFYANINGEIYSNFELGDVQFADTIEELCDEFVKVVEENDITTRLIKGYLKEIEEIREIKPSKITTYGAIYTDKGLIYVAKMNDKGGLELL